MVLRAPPRVSSAWTNGLLRQRRGATNCQSKFPPTTATRSIYPSIRRFSRRRLIAMDASSRLQAAEAIFRPSRQRASRNARGTATSVRSARRTVLLRMVKAKNSRLSRSQPSDSLSASRRIPSSSFWVRSNLRLGHASGSIRLVSIRLRGSSTASRAGSSATRIRTLRSTFTILSAIRAYFRTAPRRGTGG